MTFLEAAAESKSRLRLKCTNAQAYLILTPDEVNADLLAKLLIADRLSLGEERMESLLADRLVDVYFLPFGEKTLTSDIEYLTQTANLRPTQFDTKFFVFRKFETANEICQNKLLKVLEEPPENTVIILLCADEYSVLPTVKSRCVVETPEPYSIEVMERLSHEQGADKELAAVCSGGSLKRFQRLLKDENVFDKTIERLLVMRKSKDILSVAVELSAEKDLREVLDAFETIFHDIAVFSSSPSLVIMKSRVADIRELRNFYGDISPLKILPLITQAKKRVKYYGNPSSIIDELLFSILEVRAKCQKL